MREYTVWITNHQYAVCHIEAESKEEAILEAQNRYENRQLDYYEEKIGTIEVNEE